MGNPLQYSCLGNPMGRGAWQAPVPEVTKSQTQLGTHTQPGLGMAPNPVTVSSGEKPSTRRQRCSDAATSPGRQWGWGDQELKRREGPTPESPDEWQPFPHPDSGLQTWRNKVLSL